jgi:hypothetical protein
MATSGVDEDAREFWISAINRTLSEGQPISFPKILESGDPVPQPSAAGFFTQSIGEIKGQIADWRASLQDDERGFHAVEYTDRFECHLDKKDPAKDPFGHLVEDSPSTLALGIGVAALAIGATLYYLYRKEKG